MKTYLSIPGHCPCISNMPSLSLATDWHVAHVTSGNISWEERLVNSKHTVKGNLPHTEEGEDESKDLPNVEDDKADKPVDKIWDPVSRLSHFNFSINKVK